MEVRQKRRGGCEGGRSKRAVGQSPRPPCRLSQQDDHHCCGTARGRGRGLDPQIGRTGAGRRPDGVVAVNLTRPAALPPCRERAVEFTLPPIESAADIAATMKAVTSALAGGLITPAEAATTAAVVDTFVRAIETSDFERPLRLVEAEDFNRPDEAAGVNGAGPNGYYYNP